MGPSSLDQDRKAQQRRDKPCWREIMATAFAGFYITDQQLENMLDHLERMP